MKWIFNISADNSDQQNTMSSTTRAITLMKRAVRQLKMISDELYTEEELKEFYPTDGDMEHLWRTWCEVRIEKNRPDTDMESLAAMKNDLDEGMTAETIYEECAGADEQYDYIDHGVLSARYHEHLPSYKVGVYRVLGFTTAPDYYVLDNEQNYIADVLFERVAEYIVGYLLAKVNEKMATTEE